MVSVETTHVSHGSTETAIDNMYTNVYSCVPINLYLQTPEGGQIRPAGHGLPVPALENRDRRCRKTILHGFNSYDVISPTCYPCKYPRRVLS